MNAVELLKPDGTKSGVFYCQTCNKVSSDEGVSERCCAPTICPECETEVSDRGRIRHETCWLQWRFRDAVKLDKWEGWVYWEAAGDAGNGEGYFDSLESLLEWFEEERQPAPEWVFTCKTESFPRLDIDDMLTDLAEGMFEDAEDNFHGVDELKEAVSIFNEDNKGLVSYHPNYGQVVYTGVSSGQHGESSAQSAS